MAIFTNQATLTYNGTSTNSNVAYGEILEILAAAKTSVEESYTQGSCYPHHRQCRSQNRGSVLLFF